MSLIAESSTTARLLFPPLQREELSALGPMRTVPRPGSTAVMDTAPGTASMEAGTVAPTIAGQHGSETAVRLHGHRRIARSTETTWSIGTAQRLGTVSRPEGLTSTRISRATGAMMVDGAEMIVPGKTVLVKTVPVKSGVAAIAMIDGTSGITAREAAADPPSTKDETESEQSVTCIDDEENDDGLYTTGWRFAPIFPEILKHISRDFQKSFTRRWEANTELHTEGNL